MSNGEPVRAPQAPPPVATPPPDTGSRDQLFRAITFLVVLGSVVVILWSFFGLLLPRVKQSRELSSTVARLSTEVDDLERQWTTAQIAQVTNQFSQVDSVLFQGRTDVEAWLANLKELAASMGLEMATSYSQPSLQTVGGRTLTVLPATVTLEIQRAAPDTAAASPYKRILQLGQHLSGEKKRVDLKELNLDGGTNSVSRVVLVLNHWTEKERAP
jgi:hypothetical protein